MITKEILKTDTVLPSVVIRDIIKDWEVDAQNILITSFVIKTTDNERVVRLSGDALDRTSLSRFVNTLKTDSRLSDITFPLSDLASGEQIPFSLTMTFK